MIPMKGIIDELVKHPDPSIRWKTRINALGESPRSRTNLGLQQEIRTSQTVSCQRRFLNSRTGSGSPRDVYAKWQGPHWILATLADIGYPKRDKSLKAVRDQLQNYWLQETFYTDFEAKSKKDAHKQRGVPVMEGRHRRCASQQSNALWSILKLGLENEETHKFVERLLYWQWPDGGWNCDKNPVASHSSFMESILPLRALALYASQFDDKAATKAAKRASEVFLKRHLYIGQHTSKPIKSEFVCLHYPLYWHYDILHGLKVMAESGFLQDKRCSKALDVLESKQLPDGGWPAEKKHYKTSEEIALGNDFVDWGGTAKRKMNPWVTVDALYVLRMAGRVQV